jgi:plasmid maintenance system killer protein
MIHQGGAEMRWRAILSALLFLLPAATAVADTQVSECGRYSIWVPDTWKITIKNERLTAESHDNKLYLVVAPIEDREADLIDDEVTDFIDAELENMKVTSDRREKLGGVAARIMEGTGTDDGNKIFRAVALDPGENEALIEVLIYGAPGDMKRPANKAILDRIVGSLKPPPAVADALVNACGKYSIWLPDRWKITIKNERVTAQSRDNKLYLVVAPIEDKSASLLDDDVADFIDDELEDMKITSDGREKLGGIEARVMEGTGTDDGDMSFRAVALKPSENAGVIEVLIYGSPGEMKLAANRAVVDRILRSLKPI